MSMPAGNVEKGKRIFVTTCASINPDGPHKIGPNLHGSYGRKSGEAAGYAYSKAHKDKGVIWNENTLFEYLENPKKYIPGTKKPYTGLKKANHCADVIAYIKTASK